MIKGNEIRVGNLLRSESKNGYESPGVIVVRDIGASGINRWSDMGASGQHPYEELFGIPLTPEILEKCELKNANGKWKRENWSSILYLKGGMVTTTDNKPWAFWIVIGGCEIPIKHAHQLQNLIFSLTGEELPYKP